VGIHLKDSKPNASNDWDSIINLLEQEYSDAEQPLDLKSTEHVHVAADYRTRIFKVSKLLSKTLKRLYIVDTPQAREVVCNPHVVGEELHDRMYATSVETMKAISQLTDAFSDGSTAVLYHIWRASPGYRWTNAYKTVVGKELPEIGIRTKYVIKSYRKHEKVKRLKIVARNFKVLRKIQESEGLSKELTILNVDTVATGNSGKKAINALVSYANANGLKIKRVVLGGLMSVEGLQALTETAERHGIEVYAFPLVALTGLYPSNRYDMPLYGYDEQEWRKKKQIIKIGSIIDKQTLLDCLPYYLHSLDTAGDFSDRQIRLYNGKKYETVDLRQHLRRTRTFIRNILKMPGLTGWQIKIGKNKLRKINDELKKLSTV